MARRRRGGTDDALMRYAVNGPAPIQIAFLKPPPGVSHSHHAFRMLDEWKHWHDEHLEAWRSGEDAPPPPNQDIFLEGGE